MRAIPIVVMLVALLGCPQPEPEPEIPDISGHYALAAQQRDSDCVPSIASPDQVMGFLETTQTGVPLLAMQIEQEGDVVEGTLDASGCVWSGRVDAQGAFTLTGPCDGADVRRTGRVGATATPFGADWDVDGTLSVEVDTLDAGGEPGPDGALDCEVLLDLSGTGQ